MRPTLDRDPLTAAIDDIQLSDATAIGDALSAGTQVLVDLAGDNGPPTTDATGAPTGPPPGAIVLLSDGETTVGRPTEVGAQEAAAAGIPVFTIAFGTPDGTIVDPTTGETIPVPVQPDALSEVAADDRWAGVRGGDRGRAHRRLPAHPERARRHARRARRAGDRGHVEVGRRRHRPARRRLGAVAVVAPRHGLTALTAETSAHEV